MKCPSINPNELKSLQSTEGVSEAEYKSGQVLLYQGHMAPGLFVLTSGALSRIASEGEKENVEVNGESYPLLDHGLEEASEVTLLAYNDVTLVFIPRSLYKDSKEIQALLRTTKKSGLKSV